MPKAPTYSPTRPMRALLDFQNGQGSLRSIAKRYGIPRATLQFKLKNPACKTAFGPSPVLTEVEENTIVRWITELAQKGFPRKKSDIISSVQQFLRQHPRPNPFKDNRPGEGWMKAFLKRHPEIVTRSPEPVTSASACVSENDIRKWFADIQKYIEEKSLENVIKDPSRIFNGDETGFLICPESGKVLAPRGCKNVYTIDRGSSKENITVMFTFSADGKICSPMVVFPYKRIPEKISMTIPEDWGIGRSDNGWMTAQTFYEYIANVFHPYLLKQGVELPVILFIDGHKSHLTYQLSVLCGKLGIELIALYPNATRILQPADVAVFRPIKMCWQKTVREWHAEHPGEAITKVTFTPLLKKVVISSVKSETLRNGFKACGLYPFNANAIDYSKCLGGSKHFNAEDVGDSNGSDFNISMNYSTFLGIVGKEKVELFEQIENAVNDHEDEHFFTLYRLWKYFNRNSNREEIVCQRNISEIVPPSDLEIGLVSSLPQTDGQIQAEHLQSREEFVEDVTQNEGTGVVPVETATVVQIHRPSNISDYLVWPESPKRKGKRQTDRLPFAITSQKYKQMLEAKNEAKLSADKEKEKKRKEREEAKAAKAQKKMMKSVKSQLKCFICNRQKSDLSCDDCKKVYHSKCIPKSHQQHIPELEDNDQFLCHECYKEDPSDESTLEDLGYAEENTAKDADDITQGSNLEDTELTMQEYSRNDEDYVMKEDTVESGKSAEVDEIEELYQYYINNKDK